MLRDETFDPRGKMKPRWSGPFFIKKNMLGGATRIIDLDGEKMLRPINMDRLQRYHICKKKKKKRKKPARLKTRKGDLGKS